MKFAELAAIAGGALSLLVAAGHTAFDRLFRWGPELERLSPRNRRVLYTIHVALYLQFLPIAIASIAYPGELARPGLGGALALAYALFWAWRLVWQLVYFRPLLREASPAWRGLHVGIVVACGVLVASYGIPAAEAWLR